MIRLTNLADYAVILMCEMVHMKDRANAQGLSAATQLPIPTVSKILNALSKAELLHSKRGLGGGFSLVKPASEITVTMIIEAIDGPIAITTCAYEEGDSCDRHQVCAMQSRWRIINDAVRTALDHVPLSILAEAGCGDELRALFEKDMPDAKPTSVTL